MGTRYPSLKFSWPLSGLVSSLAVIITAQQSTSQSQCECCGLAAAQSRTEGASKTVRAKREREREKERERERERGILDSLVDDEQNAVSLHLSFFSNKVCLLYPLSFLESYDNGRTRRNNCTYDGCLSVHCSLTFSPATHEVLVLREACSERCQGFRCRSCCLGVRCAHLGARRRCRSVRRKENDDDWQTMPFL